MKRKDYNNHKKENANASCLKKIRQSLQNKINDLEGAVSNKDSLIKKLICSIKDYEKKIKEKDSEIVALEKMKINLEKEIKRKDKSLSELKSFLSYGFNKFMDEDIIDDRPLNINNEIKNRERKFQNEKLEKDDNQIENNKKSKTRFNTPEKNEHKRNISGRNYNSNNNIKHTLSEYKTTKNKGMIKSEGNLVNKSGK